MNLCENREARTNKPSITKGITKTDCLKEFNGIHDEQPGFRVLFIELLDSQNYLILKIKLLYLQAYKRGCNHSKNLSSEVHFLKSSEYKGVNQNSVGVHRSTQNTTEYIKVHRSSIGVHFLLTPKYITKLLPRLQTKPAALAVKGYYPLQDCYEDIWNALILIFDVTKKLRML